MVKEFKMKPNKLFKPTTDMSYYDGLLSDKKYALDEKGIVCYIEYMTPKEYLKAVITQEGFKGTLKEHISDMMKYRTKDYAQNMKDGDKFPIPILEYRDNTDIVETQEGNHRALAVQVLIDEGLYPKTYKIPVGIFIRKGKGFTGFFG